ncbi:septum site-determining protein Ssd [Tomitella biformata]|uniref:septum site-determining protein Ssd n=1 Tax=Tomitella biformata TaxID=630403 RepID=UPI0004B577BF|nr:septum site-determining protein Ssd [Tomitella biformata]
MGIDEPRPEPVLSWLSGPVLRGEVSRATAAAAVAVEELDSAPGRGQWDRARTLLLDVEAAGACIEAGLPRRGGVLVLSDGSEGADPWQLAVRLGAEHVLALPADAAQLVRLLGSAPRATGAGTGGVVAVVGGKGGVGASVFAAAVAACAQPAALLVDLDPMGAGLDLMFGLERASGLRWPDLRLQGGRVHAAALRRALPSKGGVSVLSSGRDLAPPAEPAVRAVLEAGRDGGLVVVCDVSRSRSPVAELALELADLVVLLATADVSACAAAARAAAWILPHNPNRCLVVRGPSPGGLRATDISAAVGLPLLTSMRPEPGLARRLEHSGLVLGRRSPLAAAAGAVLRVHNLRPDGAA